MPPCGISRSEDAVIQREKKQQSLLINILPCIKAHKSRRPLHLQHINPARFLYAAVLQLSFGSVQQTSRKRDVHYYYLERQRKIVSTRSLDESQEREEAVATCPQVFYSCDFDRPGGCWKAYGYASHLKKKSLECFGNWKKVSLFQAVLPQPHFGYRLAVASTTVMPVPLAVCCSRHAQ